MSRITKSLRCTKNENGNCNACQYSVWLESGGLDYCDRERLELNAADEIERLKTEIAALRSRLGQPDVVPAHWIKKQNPRWPAYEHDACSICGWWNTKNAMCYKGAKKPGHSLNYCPNCGAKMY